MALAPGTILGHYVIRSPLGAGGMGEVYRAHDTRLDRDVAIKVLPPSLTSDPDRLRRFEQEARAAAALNHPNILAVHQMGTHDGLSYLVSELLEGETLRERFRRGPVPLLKAVDYGVQIARGLAAAHERGIVHRDLKPENLFVTKDGRVKILDFGLAKLTQPSTAPDATVTRETEPGVVMGSVGYMSPEQVRGEVADHRSDIFAFGVILYEMVAGRQTFRKPTSAETMTAILNEEPAPLSQIVPNVPPGFQRVVHRCLEKNSEQRFHSASDLGFALEALSESAITAPAAAQQKQRSTRRWIPLAGLAGVIVLGAGALVYLRTQPNPVPRVSNYTQLTHDGRPKILGSTDGARLYLAIPGSGSSGLSEMSVTGGASGLSEMSVNGGEPRALSILLSPDMYPRSISADGSELLVIKGQTTSARGPLWSVPILGGSPRRLGDAEGQDGAWSPDGKMLAYCNASNLFMAKADGTEARKVVALKDSDITANPAWSPDGSALRFIRTDFNLSTSSIWEVSAEGTGLHPILPGWHNPPDECCGNWTPDRRFYVFLSRNQLWALQEKRGLLRRETRPIQLTSSPMSLANPVLSRDGKKIFVVGAIARGEMMRYDSRSRRFSPFLAGASAEFPAFSKDGQWVAYTSYPEATLWRSRVDGSDRLQLTYPPNAALLPRWSPDGKKIVFFELPQDKVAKISEVSAEGGTSRQLLPNDPRPQQDPNWSPDGSRIVFASKLGDTTSAIRMLDLKNSQISTVPGSEGFFSPRWSPDGHYLAAMPSDAHALLLFDFATRKWSQLAAGIMAWPAWSHDGKDLYVLEASGMGTVLKVHIADRKTSRMLDLKNFVATGYYRGSLAIGPDDSPLLLRDAGSYDVYALDWEAP
ncbi:MAG: serine/threonine protein kinase [Acidobacteria bacterium]|nr:serine/threonine protein kinase [Acidobacteriota bacterium]